MRPGCPRRAESGVESSRCRRASSASRSCHRRSTMPATACVRSGRSPRSRTRSAAIRTREPRPAVSCGVIRQSLAPLVLLLVFCADAQAQRTDVVTLGNGDRITGEIINLERGRLEFKTDDAGTLYLEWDKLTSVVTTRLVEVVTTDGRRFLGSMDRAPDRSIAVSGSQGSVTLQMTE